MIYYTSDLHFGHKKEIWKNIPNYEGLYQISNLGRVKRLAYSKEISPKGYKQVVHYKEKILKLYFSKNYIQVNLCKNGKSTNKLVHRLVAEAFIPNPNNYKYINHKDENKHNNWVENLEWCTQQYNVLYGNGYKRHKDIFREKYGKSVDQYDKNGNFIKTFTCINDVEPEFLATKVVACCKGKRKSHKNFIWIYHEKDSLI